MKRSTVTKKLMLALALGITGLMSVATPVLAASTGGTTQTSRPDQAQVILDNLADKLGRALTASEIKAVNAALTSGKEQIEDANATLVKNIASAFGLSQDQVKEALKKRAALVQTLAEMVGRKLTATEIQALRDRHERAARCFENNSR